MTDHTHNIDATESRRESERDDPHDAAIGTLRELGGADELSWRYECETYGYHFDPDEFRVGDGFDAIDWFVAKWVRS
jgi:hypothetical protein